MNRFMFLVLLLLPLSAQAAPVPHRLNQGEIDQIKKLRDSADFIHQLEVEKSISHDEAERMQSFVVHKAYDVSGVKLQSDTHQQFIQSLDNLLQEQVGFLGKVARLATFTNIVLAFAAMLIVFALAWLVGIYFLYILIIIPKPVYEVLLYSACLIALTKSNALGAWAGLDPIWFVFPACLGFLGALWVTYGLHIRKGFLESAFDQMPLFWGSRRNSDGLMNFTTFSSLICAGVWGLVAYLHQSELIAFITTMAVMSFLGFSFFVAPFCIGVGYDDEALIPRTTFASFLILSIGVVCQIAGFDLGRFQVFVYPFIWLGTFVYFCSLLIVANKWYSKDNYWILTLVTIVSGVAALYLGSLYDISVLQKMGGTFFFLWVVEKYFEIPWGSSGLAWATLVGGILLYFFGSFASKHPDYFFFKGTPAKASVSHVQQR